MKSKTVNVIKIVSGRHQAWQAIAPPLTTNLDAHHVITFLCNYVYLLCLGFLSRCYVCSSVSSVRLSVRE